jgi:hypothetical protein
MSELLLPNFINSFTERCMTCAVLEAFKKKIILCFSLTVGCCLFAMEAWSAWDLWWIKCYWSGFFLSSFVVSCQLLIKKCSIQSVQCVTMQDINSLIPVETSTLKFALVMIVFHVAVLLRCMKTLM